MQSNNRNTAEKKQWLEERKIDFLHGNTPYSALASAFVILFFAWVQRDYVIHNHLPMAWVAIHLVITLLRLVHSLERKRTSPIFSNRQWLMTYRGLVIATGLLYGAMIYVFFEQSSIPMQAVIMFLVIGIPASAMATLGIDRITYLGLLLTTILPSAAYLNSLDQSEYRAAAILFLMFAVTMERVSRRATAFILQNIEMTYAMSYRATHDSLVGLLNREELERQFDLRAPNSKHAVALLFIDLDNFKPLNDTLGHQVGDQALVRVANIIQQETRSSDITARLGGDEFVVVLFLDTVETAQSIAQNIANAVDRLTFGSQYSGLTTSIGICFHNTSDISFSRMLRTADIALYESKAFGKNKVTLLYYEQK